VASRMTLHKVFMCGYLPPRLMTGLGMFAGELLKIRTVRDDDNQDIAAVNSVFTFTLLSFISVLLGASNWSWTRCEIAADQRGNSAAF
jgi:hypothetical protein